MRLENHCTSPSLLHTTHQSESVRQPGQSTTSIEFLKVKNPDPMLHLIQHHLALLHTSSRGNDRIGSSDLLDSGGWVPSSLQVHHLWCTGGQRGAHPWDHICNQQPTNQSTQMSKPNMRLAPRLNQTNHQRAFHTTLDTRKQTRSTEIQTNPFPPPSRTHPLAINTDTRKQTRSTEIQTNPFPPPSRTHPLLPRKHTPHLTSETPPLSVP